MTKTKKNYSSLFLFVCNVFSQDSLLFSLFLSSLLLCEHAVLCVRSVERLWDAPERGTVHSSNTNRVTKQRLSRLCGVYFELARRLCKYIAASESDLISDSADNVRQTQRCVERNPNRLHQRDARRVILKSFETLL